MSQAGLIVPQGAPLAATTYVEDAGVATPALNLLNVVTGATDGIATAGVGNTITLSLRNRIYGTVTTNNAVPTALFTLPLGAVPAAYTLDMSISGFDPVDGFSACYTLVGGISTDGLAASFLNEQLDEFEDPSASACNAEIIQSGNNAVVQVVGLAGKTFNWKVVGSYILVS